MNVIDWGGVAHVTMQYNLQQNDASRMDMRKIARETRETGCDTVCINVCGACTWYPTKIPFLKVHPLVAAGRDLLREMLDACHAEGIKVLGRFAWGMLEDDIYHQKPQWAARNVDGTPITINEKRPGMWNQLYSSCYNAGYQREEVMLPAMCEVVENYDLDGIFWCAGFAFPCWCDACKRAYRQRYGKPLPDSAADFEPDWLAESGESCTRLFYETLKRVKPELPFIRYYWPFDLDMGGGTTLKADSIPQKAQSADILCTEAQDILSLGAGRIPAWNTPAMRMKMGRIMQNKPAPICIVHTCPGMDWRHVQMPTAEYLYWSAQVVANGGRFWVSLTGFFDTLYDRRMVGMLQRICGMIGRVADDMRGARSAAQALLISDGGVSTHGWSHALMCSHIDFDMETGDHLADIDTLRQHGLVILPAELRLSDEQLELVRQYVAQGGQLIIEGNRDDRLAPYAALTGVRGGYCTSEELVATYVRIEEKGAFLKKRLGETELYPLRGRVAFCEPGEGAEVLATWVPPFSTFAASGNPPERATLPTPHTQVPMCLVNHVGQGRVMLLPYAAGELVEKYALRDMIDTLGGYAEHMLGELQVALEAPEDVMLTQFAKEDALLLHLVNGIGQRPLKDCVPCHDLRLRVRLPQGKQALSVTCAISGQSVAFRQEGGTVSFEVPVLQEWEMVKIALQ